MLYFGQIKKERMILVISLKKLACPEAVGLAFRVVPTAPKGAKPSHKLSPVDVVNLHWSVADEVGQVVFSTNTPVNLRAHPNISRVFLFAAWRDQQFLCSAEVVDILSPAPEKYLRTSVPAEIQVPEWRGEDAKTVMILRDFQQLDPDTCDLVLLNKNVLLRDQIRVPRFRTCFVKL